jgi:hypothetical protein
MAGKRGFDGARERCDDRRGGGGGRKEGCDLTAFDESSRGGWRGEGSSEGSATHGRSGE